MVATYEEFQRKGREKVGLSPSEPVRVVLEGDGTQVKFFSYIKMKSNNQITQISYSFFLVINILFSVILGG